MTEVIKCGCSHAYQDEKYGKSLRVHNARPAVPNKAREFRCTVCGQVHTKGGGV